MQLSQFRTGARHPGLYAAVNANQSRRHARQRPDRTGVDCLDGWRNFVSGFAQREDRRSVCHRRHANQHGLHRRRTHKWDDLLLRCERQQWLLQFRQLRRTSCRAGLHASVGTGHHRNPGRQPGRSFLDRVDRRRGVVCRFARHSQRRSLRHRRRQPDGDNLYGQDSGQRDDLLLRGQLQ